MRNWTERPWVQNWRTNFWQEQRINRVLREKHNKILCSQVVTGARYRCFFGGIWTKMAILGIRSEVVISGICTEAAPAPYLLHSVVRFALSTCPTALGFRLWLQNVSTQAHWLLGICSLEWNFEHRQRNILWVERYTLNIYIYRYAKLEKVCCAVQYQQLVLRITLH